MPDLNEFMKNEGSPKGYELEELHGIRPCSQCEEDVAGALWDPHEYTMKWVCSKGHKTEYRVS